MIIYAININTGGGKVLLDELIQHNTFGVPKVLFLDARYVFPAGRDEKKIQIFRVQPNVFSRWRAEFVLKKVAHESNGFVFAFGNLPPAFRLPVKTVVYLQNAFLLPNSSLPQDGFKGKLRCLYEKVWFDFFKNHADEFWVQTKWMKASMPATLKLKTKLVPFLPTFPQLIDNGKTIDFLTITSSQKHKNLLNFLKGALESNLKGAKFAVVTDSTNVEIDQLIQKMKENHMQIDFYIKASREKTLSLVQQSRYIVITSTIESFCLPLHEALHYHTKIIAGEFSFITEYVQPSFVINPLSHISVSQAFCSAFRA